MRTGPALSVSILFSLLLGCLFLFSLDVLRGLTQPLAEKETRQFELASGASLRSMASRLHADGMLAHRRDVFYLALVGRITGMASRLQAGEYRITAAMSPLQLLAAMERGDVIQYGFTIVEGWNLRQVLDALAVHGYIVHSEPPLSAAALAKAFELETKTAEGWLYPDTYHFPRNETDLSVLRRAHNAMRKVLEAEWSQRAEGLPYANAYEALIMASIIEKETAVESERQQIAGVFVRRLQKGMRLQTDPTVIYGMGERFDGNIRRADLLKATPYNTYTQDGLPPTPIAMPGRASIYAALHPEPGDSLYFVSRGDGSHVFSATLKEHNQAVREFQLGQGGRKQAQE